MNLDNQFPGKLVPKTLLRNYWYINCIQKVRIGDLPKRTFICDMTH